MWTACEKTYDPKPVPPTDTDSTGVNPPGSHDSSANGHPDTTKPGQPHDSTGTGNGQTPADSTHPSDSTVTPPPPGIYLPHTAQSWWKYQEQSSGETYISTATGQTASFDGIAFQVFSDAGNAGTLPEYLATRNNDYYQHLSFKLDTVSIELTVKYLNAAATNGATWASSGSVMGIAAKVKTTLVGQGLTLSVGGKTYNNVVHTSSAISVTFAGFTIKVGQVDYYSAQNIGIIRRQISASLSNLPSLPGVPALPDMSYENNVDLVDYSVL
ncbi:hypothetical protein DXN05_03260 [Deminuibacter soli]|uniref:Uncharacterized protein n=2 Tax=Deminuibacter soli TaxID=2291815 RepID=A0A3E1NQB2_9BACT|nr:hypothetical protein DXN05_03260 [Deminuibacter soli]